MAVTIRPACLHDGVAVLDLLEQVGYYPEPISFAQTFRRSLTDSRVLLRVAEVAGKVVGVASVSLRYQLGLGGLLASLDELAIAAGSTKSVGRALLRATAGRARAMGAVRVIKRANENTPPPRAAQVRSQAVPTEAPRGLRQTA
jgi:N-acetylglutamate synthase-like GNAT family acetyltransferase